MGYAVGFFLSHYTGVEGEQKTPMENKMVKQGLEENMTFAQRMQFERRRRGWSQARMASELETTPNTISLWERGRVLPSPYFREKVCQWLGMDAAELGLMHPLPDVGVTTDQGMHEPDAMQQLPCEQNQPYAGQVQHVPETITTSSSFPVIAKVPPTPSPGTGPRTSSATDTRGQKYLLKRFRLPLMMACLLLLSVLGGCLGRAILVRFSPSSPALSLKDPYVGLGLLTLQDPLDGERNQVNWEQGQNENQAGCQFENRAYSVSQPLEGFFHACMAEATDFENFVYEVQMTLESGDYGGLIFRAVDSITSKYYLFRVYDDGRYELRLYLDRYEEDAPLLVKGRTSAFHRGYQQANLLAVVADAATLGLYINHQLVATVQNQTYAEGQIGVFVGDWVHAPACGKFGQVRVWAW